jgi:(S)-2-hydroxyglutarate dehydrogenase
VKPFDVAIVGAGIVGLATAREILRRQPRMRVIVLEKEPHIALHQTSHNSGVIHSGIYYRPGSLKARLCVEGMGDLIKYCGDRGIPVERCGKVVVATDPEEEPRLRELFVRAQQNGVEGVEIIDSGRLRELEPYCAGLHALWVPGTSIVDFRQVATAYANDIVTGEGEIATGHDVRGVRFADPGLVITTGKQEIQADRMIACAGLYSDRIAIQSGASRDPVIAPFRGKYWRLAPSAAHLVRNLIYPVPDPAFPFLGVHATRHIGTHEILLGPSAVLALSREGYRRRDIKLRETIGYAGSKAFVRMAARYWRFGALEAARDIRKGAFLSSVRRYLPEVTAKDLVPGPSGVRAQALSRNGFLIDDFVVEAQGDRILHVRNAPSPAATSSLAIASLIADRAFATFGWTGTRATY